MLNPRELRALAVLDSRHADFLIKSELPPGTGAVSLGWLIELGLITEIIRGSESAWRITAQGRERLAVESIAVEQRRPGRPTRGQG